MKCPNCEVEAIEEGKLFSFLRAKKKESIVCSNCGYTLKDKTVYSLAGRLGGSAVSDKKAKSSRINGRLGGRPRKKKK